MSNRGSKKGKSSEFDAEDDDHIKSGPVVKVYSHEGFILTSKIAKSFNEAKKRVSNATPKFFQRSTERLFRVPKIQISKINCKIKSISSGLVTRRLHFLKKYDTKQTFSPSCRN